MLEDKKRSTDWEATYDAIEEAVARESYLTWLRENEKRTLPGKHAGSQVGKGSTNKVKGLKKKKNVFFLLYTALVFCLP